MIQRVRFISVILTLLALAAMLTTLLSSCSSASGSVAGTVTNAEGQPQAGVMVQIYSIVDEDTSLYLKTAEDGSYRFNSIVTGTWTVEIYYSSGDLAGRQTVTVEAGVTATADFVMS